MNSLGDSLLRLGGVLACGKSQPGTCGSGTLGRAPVRKCVSQRLVYAAREITVQNLRPLWHKSCCVVVYGQQAAGFSDRRFLADKAIPNSIIRWPLRGITNSAHRILGFGYLAAEEKRTLDPLEDAFSAT